REARPHPESRGRGSRKSTSLQGSEASGSPGKSCQARIAWQPRNVCLGFLLGRGGVPDLLARYNQFDPSIPLSTGRRVVRGDWLGLTESLGRNVIGRDTLLH